MSYLVDMAPLDKLSTTIELWHKDFVQTIRVRIFRWLSYVLLHCRFEKSMPLTFTLYVISIVKNYGFSWFIYDLYLDAGGFMSKWYNSIQNPWMSLFNKYYLSFYTYNAQHKKKLYFFHKYTRNRLIESASATRNNTKFQEFSLLLHKHGFFYMICCCATWKEQKCWYDIPKTHFCWDKQMLQ